MNIYLQERKKSVFTNYKTTRATISLNKAIAEQKNFSDTSWANNWLEQVTEMKSDCAAVNQTLFRNNKLIIKWWEN